MFTITEGAAISRKALVGIAVTPRGKGEVTERWKGVAHSELADTVVDRVENAGFKIKSERWGTAMNNAALYGTLDLLPLPEMKIELPRGVGLSLGLRHSNNGRHALTFFAGVRVFVCSNGMISERFTPGERKRHTMNLNLSDTVDAGLVQFADGARANLAAEIKALQGMDYTNELKVHNVLCRTGAEGLVPWSQLGKVEQAWRTPPHPEFKDRNGWSLYNAFTEVAKSFSPTNQARAIGGLRGIFQEVARDARFKSN
jgi:hypothetical protein